MEILLNSPTSLGRLAQIDLRTAWGSESGHFTPWLAQADNLALLSETIGIDLELEAQEHNVGPFRADILCKATATNHWVLIENQLERTDHGHLGQLVTYAAGLDAVTIVWIAAKFTDEHRAALDWLNEKTADAVDFFGLEIELWRIGESPLAPKFNIVSKPNDWTAAVSGTAKRLEDAALTPAKELQVRYWAELRRVIQERGGSIKPVKPLAQNWLNFALGRSVAVVSATINIRERWIKASIVLESADARVVFESLYLDRVAIEDSLGMPLEWNGSATRKMQLITLIRRDTDPSDVADWPEQHEWLYARLNALHRVFSSRVRRGVLVANAERSPSLSEMVTGQIEDE